MAVVFRGIVVVSAVLVVANVQFVTAVVVLVSEVLCLLSAVRDAIGSTAGRNVRNRPFPTYLLMG